MKYFLDTEFLEGTQRKWFGETKPTIDLISIGIVAEDGREYYAISKDFNLKEAWNRYDWKQKKVSDGIPGAYKDYWIRENVLKLIYDELTLHHTSVDWYYNNPHLGEKINDGRWLKFNHKSLEWLISKYGKTNKQIAEEIKYFVANRPIGLKKEHWILDYDTKDVKFYGYEQDKCFVFINFMKNYGSLRTNVTKMDNLRKMIDLPKGFPMYCIDLKQTLDEKALNWKGNLQQTLQIHCDDFDSKLDAIKSCKEYPKQTNEHDALSDARWNYRLYNFLNTL